MIYYMILQALTAYELEVCAVARAEHHIGIMAANVECVTALACSSRRYNEYPRLSSQLKSKLLQCNRKQATH